MSTQTLRGDLRRPAAIAFGAGFVMAFVAPMLALVSRLVEDVLRLLVPGAALLQPLSDRMAGWNGFLNLTLAGIANGAVYALVVVAALMAGNALRHR